VPVDLKNLIEGIPLFIHRLCQCIDDGIQEVRRGSERLSSDTDGNKRIFLKNAGVYSLDLFAASMKLILFGNQPTFYPENDRNVMTTG
jgi:hypothetical protein